MRISAQFAIFTEQYGVEVSKKSTMTFLFRHVAPNRLSVAPLAKHKNFTPMESTPHQQPIALHYENLIAGRLLRRYARFLADVELSDGSTATAHCPNSGSMRSCIEPQAEVMLTHTPNPNRRTQYTWELVRTNNCWVCINTQRANTLAIKLIKTNSIPSLNGYSTVQPEVRFGDSRFDIFAQNTNNQCFIEVKSVTLRESNRAQFPDSPTARGLKHLHALMNAKAQGYRAAMLYMIQRADVEIFAPAWHIDKAYAQALLKAHSAGVEVFAMRIDVSPQGLTPIGLIPYQLHI